MSETLEGIVVDVSKMETTTPTREKSSAVGNASAMREALEKVRFYLPHFLQYMRLHREDDEAGGYYEKILQVVNAALSAPTRNCDVGTCEEQEKRFNSFCKTHLSGIRSICSPQCPCVCCRSMFHCLTKWAQMPYEEVK